MDEVTKLKLEEYFDKNISPEDLAKFLRRFKYEATRMLLALESDDIVRKDWFADGHYFITQLCEILDPQLEDE